MKIDYYRGIVIIRGEIQRCINMRLVTWFELRETDTIFVYFASGAEKESHLRLAFNNRKDAEGVFDALLAATIA